MLGSYPRSFPNHLERLDRGGCYVNGEQGLGDDWTPLAIFSQPAVDRTALVAFLRSKLIPFKRALGFYKSEIEFSFVVRRDSLDEIERGGWLASQTSVLLLAPREPFIGGGRPATMGHLANLCFDVDPEPLGMFRPVSATEAWNLDAWTWDQGLNKFYAVIPPATEGATT